MSLPTPHPPENHERNDEDGATMTLSSSTRRLISGLAAAALTCTVAGLSGIPAAEAGPARGKVTKPAPVDPKAKVKPGKPLTKRSGTVTMDAALAVGSTVNHAKTGVRALIVADNATDWGLATYKRTLDRVGAQYDVFRADSAPLTESTLIAGDGSGRYNAILLTNSTQPQLDETEWNLLWAYERSYSVRQATLYTSWGSSPEDYCLSPGTEGGAPVTASLTSAGANVFSYLQAGAKIPITDSYVYAATPNTSGECNATPVLTSGDKVLGVRTLSDDLRERMALTFSSNEYLLQSDLLVYGLFRWASRGIYLGEQRHYLNVDVDDYFNSSDHRLADGTMSPEPFRMSAADAWNASESQKRLRAKYPLASQFRLNLAYNAGDADMTAGSTCSPTGGVAELTATSKCLAGQFNWINHTYTHTEVNSTDYTTTYNEIKNNRDAGAALGLPTPAEVLKTGEYSGLGTYNPDPNDDINPPTDFGLQASNPNLLSAAKALGIKYVHGNMSFPSQQPSCFNCGIVHPLEPSIMVVPDWPTNIAYFSTNPAEETQFYNSFYGPGGRFAYWPSDRTYDQVVDYESTLAVQRVASGSIYSHTLHISNLRDYGGGKSLTFDWVDAAVGKYSSLYRVPLLTPNWSTLAGYVAERNKHFASSQNTTATYDSAAKRITVVGANGGRVTLSGVSAGVAGASRYGDEVSAGVNVKSKATVLAATPLP